MAQRKPDWISTAEAVKALGISRPAFDKWGLEPDGKIGQKHFYKFADIIEADRARRFQAPKNAESKKPIEELRYEQEKARAELLREQAEQTRLKNEITRHEMAPMDWFQFVLARMSSRVASMLDRIPVEIMRARGLGPESAEVAKGVIATVLQDVHDLSDRQFLDKALDEYLNQGAR